MRAMRLAVVLLGVGLVIGAGPVRAQDADEEDDGKSFERKLIDNLMSGLGGRRIEDGTINYRERSPLVAPSKLELNPPQDKKPKLAPNWPKDPDEAQRKADRELNNAAADPYGNRRALLPSELAVKKPRDRTASTKNDAPGSSMTAPLSMLPSELGYTGGLFSNPFASNKTETEKFVKEPERQELTQPPSGYQTPSSNFAYGVGKLASPKTSCDPKSGVCERTWD